MQNKTEVAIDNVDVNGIAGMGVTAFAIKTL
jgi:hypothetical protein